MYFCYFIIISPWKKAWPFICKKLNLHHPRMICAKFGWNWPSGSGEIFFLISLMYFCYFCYYLPLEKDGTFHLNKLESHSFKDAWTKFGLNWPSGSGILFFFILLMKFRYFIIISPIEKDGTFFEKSWIPFSYGWFVSSLVEIGPGFWRIRFC